MDRGRNIIHIRANEKAPLSGAFILRVRGLGVMMVMVVPMMSFVMMRLGRRRDGHQHGDCEQRCAERKQHLLHRTLS
jgi:hypothetical protein